MQGVLDALRKVKAICDQRAVEGDARRSISQTPQMAAANAELGQWIVELKMPLLAATPRFDRDDPSREAPVLGQIGSFENIDRLNTIDGDTHAEPSGGRLGDVGRIDNKGTAVLTTSRDPNLIVGSAHHSGNEREHIGNFGGPIGQVFNLGPL